MPFDWRSGHPEQGRGVTMAGVILGTPAYMSPEQARGQVVDTRTDVWSFGCVLYEMVSGQRPFAGQAITDLIADIVSKEPDWSVVPRPVLRLIQACLEKDPKKRLRDIADGWRLLDETSTPSAPSAAPVSRRRIAVAAPWAFAAVALFALALLGWRQFGEPRSDVRRAQFELTPPEGMSFRDPFAVSPDGRRIAFAVAGSNNVVRGLWVRSLESGEAHALPGTDDVGANGGLFWSPDSRFLAFATPQGALKKVDVENGGIETIHQLEPDQFRGGAWTGDGTVAMAGAQTGIARLPASGGAATPLVSKGAINPALASGPAAFSLCACSALAVRSRCVCGLPEREPRRAGQDTAAGRIGGQGYFRLAGRFARGIYPVRVERRSPGAAVRSPDINGDR